MPILRPRKKNDPAEMPFLEHLEELRTRLLLCIAGLLVGFIVSWIFADQILNFLLYPLKQALPPESKIIFTSIPENFVAHLKVAFLAGCFVSSPWILYQIWMFIAPGLYRSERCYVIPFVFLTALFFIGGACFGFFILFPWGFKYLLNYGTDALTAFPRLKEYLSFAASMLFAFGLIFELPIISFFLAKIGLINAASMSHYRRHAYVGIFIVAAILTPPDVVSQLMMAAPLLILYELSIFTVRLARTSKKKSSEKEAEENAETV